jgi:hypothetical protein
MYSQRKGLSRTKMAIKYRQKTGVKFRETV